jgi:hypothetical protein
MAIEVKKFGELINLAWREPRGEKLSVLFMDSEKAWGARRRRLKNEAIEHIDLYFGADGPHEMTDFAKALDVINNFDCDNLSIIACNAVVLPCLALAPALFPVSLTIVQPKSCGNLSAYQKIIEKNVSFLKQVPKVKIIYDRNDVLGSRLADELNHIVPNLHFLPLGTISEGTLEMIGTPEYLKTVLT